MTLALAINAGSSSLKIAVFAFEGGDERCLLRGAVEGIGASDARAWRRVGEGEKTDEAIDARSHLAALDHARGWLDEAKLTPIAAMGHRLVHGGPKHLAPVRVDAEVRRALEDAIPFAPLHLPIELTLVDACAGEMQGIPQVASFDTAFHRDLPERARRLPIPRALHDAGIRRYGFHGLSFEHAVRTLGDALGPRAIVAHLGSGSSLVALDRGRSIDTTMGLTPMGGLVMATRPGDLDPGVVLHMLEKTPDPRALERLLDRECGLRALSETTSDVRALLAASSNDPRAAAAIDAFCASAMKWMGAFAALLGGLDTLVFTGGIGEHAAEIRARICERLGFLGVQLDDAKNARNAGSIGAGACAVRIVEADEERVIARNASRFAHA